MAAATARSPSPVLAWLPAAIVLFFCLWSIATPAVLPSAPASLTSNASLVATLPSLSVAWPDASVPLPAPDGLATALTTLSEAPLALKVTSPAAMMVVPVVATTLSSMIAVARVAPTAALSPATAPEPVVSAVAHWAAVTLTAPLAVIGTVSAPIVALV